MMKDTYLKRLHFFLSLCMNSAECEDIVNDYDDWFNNEIGLGRSQEDICSTLPSPIRLAKIIYDESCTTEKHCPAFNLKSTLIRVALLYVFHGCLLFGSLSYFNKTGFSIIYFSLLINGIVIISSFIFPLGKSEYRNIFKARLLYLIVPVLFLIVDLLLRNLIDYRISVFWCTLLFLFIIILYSIGFIMAVGNIGLCDSILGIVSTTSLVTLLIFLINQHSIFDFNYKHMVIGSLMIYIEMIVAQLFITILRREAWIHN